MQNLTEIQIRAQGCDCVAPYIETVLSAYSPTLHKPCSCALHCSHICFKGRTEIVDC